MAKEIWAKQTTSTATIGNIKQTANISKYVFSTTDSNITGTGEQSSNSATLGASALVSATGGYTTSTIKGHLKYNFNKYDTSTAAVSNDAEQTLVVKNPLNECVTAKPTLSSTLANSDVISGASTSEITIWSDDVDPTTYLHSFTSTMTQATPAYNLSHTITSTIPSGSTGYIASITSASTSTSDTLNWWSPTSYDIGAASKTITLKYNTTTSSASQVYSDWVDNTVTIRNAVTALTASATSLTLSKSSTTNNTATITITPTTPYSSTLYLVGVSGISEESTTAQLVASGDSGVKVTISGSTVTLVCNSPKSKTTDSVITFYVTSSQNAHTVSTALITFTAKGVTTVTQDIFENETISNISTGLVGTTAIVDDTGMNGTVSAGSGATVTITANAVTEDTDYSVTATDVNGATVIISGTIKNVVDKSFDINIGDKASTTLAFTPEKVSTSETWSSSTTDMSTSWTYGTFTWSGTTLTFEANKVVTPSTQTIYVYSSTGAKQQVTVTVSNVTLTLA